MSRRCGHRHCAFYTPSLINIKEFAVGSAVSGGGLPTVVLAVVLACTQGQARSQQLEPSPNEALYRQALTWLAEGRTDQARAALQQLLELEPEHAGAWLDLAILECSTGRATEAELLFASIEKRFAPPPSLLEVIAQLRRQGCQRELSAGNFKLRLGVGTDSNVNQGASNPSFSLGSGTGVSSVVLAPEFTPRADQFQSLMAEWTQALPSDGAQGYVQVQARQHNHYPQYDLGSFAMGLEQAWKTSDWSWRASGGLGLTTLGGSVYQRQGQLQLQVTAPPIFPTGWEAGALGGWATVAYPTLSGFDSKLWEARAVLSYRFGTGFLQASLGYALDQGDAQRPGNDRQGAVASLNVRARLGERLSGEAGWSYQNWQGEQAYSPGLLDERRRQQVTLLRAGVTYAITSQQALLVELRQVYNRENISLFDYRGLQAQLGWTWQLPN